MAEYIIQRGGRSSASLEISTGPISVWFEDADHVYTSRIVTEAEMNEVLTILAKLDFAPRQINGLTTQ